MIDLALAVWFHMPYHDVVSLPISVHRVLYEEYTKAQQALRSR